MSRKIYMFLFILILLGSVSFSTAQTYSFDFTTLGDEVVSIDAYADKYIVLDWAASWCPTCEKNQQSMNDLYHDYKDEVNFISISYGGSGDGLEEVEEMKGPFGWTFGLDHDNVAEEYGVSNGYVWILSPDLELIKEWDYQIVTSSQMQEVLDPLLGRDSSESSGINTYGLFDNPLFLVFSGGIILTVGILVIRSRMVSQEKDLSSQ